MKFQKFAFIHYGKVAGRFINNYLAYNVLGDPGSSLEYQNYKTLNTSNPHIPINRDWTEVELFDIAIDCSEYQIPTARQLQVHNDLWGHGYLDQQCVHNHHINWTLNSVREFNRNEWLTFVFLKDPVELLLSLYFWATDRVNSGVNPDLVLQPTYLLELSLKEFLIEVVDCEENITRLFRLPDYVSEVGFIAEFSADNFARFLKTYFDHDYSSEKVKSSWRFRSSNKGVEYYLSTGELNKQTIEHLSRVKEIIVFRRFLASLL
ncbi:MAG: hypothetical protein ACI8P9_002289 [Parasphingorhabdus sp.]|jgi:hypothetical protein